MKKYFTLCCLLIITSNIAPVSCSAGANERYSSQNLKPVPRKQDLSNVDPAAEKLEFQIESEARIDSESSPIVFERVIDLLKYLLQTKQYDLVIERKDQIKNILFSLPPGEQQYFVPQLLSLAIETVRQLQFSVATTLYSPVITSGEKLRWQNKSEINKQLVRLAFELQQRNQNPDAEKVLQSACQISDSAPLKNHRAYHDLAMLHIKMNKNSEAADDLEKLVRIDPNNCSCYDLVRLAKVYENKRDVQKLADLTELILIRIRTTQGDRDYSQLSQLLSSYYALKLPKQASEIITYMMQHAFETSLSFECQYQMMQSAFYINEKGQYQKEAPAIYKSWTDLIKKYYGASSKEFVTALSGRLSVSRSGVNDQQCALIEHEIKQLTIAPGSIDQRLALLSLLGQFSLQNKNYVLATLDHLNENVPIDRNASAFFAESACLYNRLDSREQAQICWSKAIDALINKLGFDNRWLQTYLQKMKTKSHNNPGDESYLTNFVHEINRQLDSNPRSGLEVPIIGELAREGLVADYESFLQQRISQLALRDAHHSEIEEAIKDYALQLESKQDAAATALTTRRADFIGLAYCCYLRSFLQAHWAVGKFHNGECEYMFALDKNGVNKCRILNRSNEQNEQEALSSINALNENKSTIPEFPTLQFKASFNANSHQVKVASLQQDAQWRTPPMAATAKDHKS